MPTAAQVKALVRSHAEGDEQRFYSIAIQVAAQAGRQGHNRLAQELRNLIDRTKTGTARPSDARQEACRRPRRSRQGLPT